VPICSKVYVDHVGVAVPRLLFQMKRLQHENLNEFIGLCSDPDRFCILTAYCVKGSVEVVNRCYIISAKQNYVLSVLNYFFLSVMNFWRGRLTRL